MSSKHSKYHSCKHRIEATVHQPIQIRTNKHRCFVFCIGHTSLTCVPGIGKRNKSLLNQSGIHNLLSLYTKYRSINNEQRFKQWLQNDIGFTSYQANMTACGIGSKLGAIKEINTGLTPICCPDDKNHKLSLNDEIKQKRIRNSDSDDEINEAEVNKKWKNERIEPDNMLSSLSPREMKLKQEEETTFTGKDDPASNKLSDDYLTSVKSPDDPLFAKRPSPRKDTNSIDEILKTEPTKNSDSSSVFNETLLSNTNLTQTAEKDEKSNTISNENTYDSLWAKMSSDQNNSVSDKSPIHTEENIRSPSIVSSNETSEKPNFNEEESFNDIFISTKQTSQPTLDELLSDLKKSPNSSMASKDSVNLKLKFSSGVNAESLSPAFEHEQPSYKDNNHLSTGSPTDTDPTRNELNQDGDLYPKSKLNKDLSNENHDKNMITSIKSTSPDNSIPIMNKEVDKIVSEIMNEAAIIAKKSNSVQTLLNKEEEEEEEKANQDTQKPNRIPSNQNKKQSSLTSIVQTSNKTPKYDPWSTSHQQTTSTTKSTESLKMKTLNEKKSVSTLSSLSSSDQSIQQAPSENHLTNTTRQEEDTHEDKIRNTSTILSNPINPSLLPNNTEEKQNILENSFETINPDENTSETINPNENAILKRHTSDNHDLQSRSNTINDDYKSISSPSFPIPCRALWNNVSNEEMLLKRRKHRFTLMKNSKSNQNL